MLGLQPYIDQLNKSHNPPTLPIEKLLFLINYIRHTNVPTAILSAGCLTFLIFARIVKAMLVKRPGGVWVRYVPEIALVVVGMTGISPFFSFPELRSGGVDAKIRSEED